MAEVNYLVEAVFRANNQLTSALQSIARASGTVSKAIGKLDAQLAAMNGQFDKIAGTANAATGSVERFGLAARESMVVANTGASQLSGRLRNVASEASIASRALTAVGIASAITMGIGVKQAANMQDSTVQTAIAMGRLGSTPAGTEQNMSRFTGLAMQMSMKTAQSMPDSMNLLRTMATSGLNDPNQLAQMAMPIALFADTQFLGKNHVAFTDSAAMAAKVAHQLGARSAGEITPILNTLFKVGMDMPDSLQTAATQLKYYGARWAQQGHVSSQDILMAQATADRLGFGSGKSGTGFNMILSNLVNPTTAKMNAAQKALGIGGTSFLNAKTGQFNEVGLFDKLNADAKSYAKAGNSLGFQKLMQHAFTTNAALIAGAMSSDAGRAQYENVKKTMGRVPDLAVAQAALMETLNNQTKLLSSNFVSLASILGKQLLPPLTALVSGLATITGNLATFFAGHPTAAKATAGALTGLGIIGVFKALQFGAHVFAGISEHLGGGRVFLGLRNLGKILAPISSSLARLGVIAIPLAPEIAAVAAALALLGGALFLKGHPQIVAAVEKWWAAAIPNIAYAVGFGVGKIASLIHDGIVSMFQYLIKTVAAIPGAMMSSLAAAFKDPWSAIKGLGSGNNPFLGNLGVGSGFADFVARAHDPFARGAAAGAGYDGDIGGNRFAPFGGQGGGGNVHIHGPVHITTNDPKNFYNTLKRVPSGGNTRGTNPSLGYVSPTTLTLAGAMPH